MANLTRKNVELFFEIKEILTEKVEEVLKLKYELENGEKYCGDIIDLEKYNDEINIETEWENGYGDYKKIFYTLPMDYLFDNQWQEKVKDQLERKRLKKEAEERILKENWKIKNEQREKELYERLKRKYGE